MTTTSLQIKRSTVNTVPASLLPGELAYSGNTTSNSMFIGHPDGSTGPVRIAGQKYPFLHQSGVPGALTANAVVILDANSFHATVLASNFSIQTSGAITTPSITAINATSNSTQLGLNANTELTTTWAIQNYVSGKVAAISGSPGGANTQVQYNNSGVFAGAASFTFDQAAVVMAIGNTTVNTTINSTSFSGTANNSSFLLTKTWNAPGAIGLTTANTGAFTTLSTTSNASVSTINATAWGVSLTTNATSASVVVGNSTVQTTVNSTSFTGTSNNSSALLGLTWNAPGAVGLTTANTGAFTTLSTTSNASISTINATAWGVSLTTNATAASVVVGNTTVQTTINSTSFTGTSNNSSALLGFTWVAPGSIGLTTANTGAFTTLSTTANASVSTINATAWGVSLTTNATSASVVVGNSSVNTTINSTSFTGTANNSTNLGGVAAGSYALTASPTFTGTVTEANLVVTGTTNTALLNVSGNAVFSGAVVNATASVINAMDLVLTGNLTISGTTTTLNSTNLVINDPTIQLGDNNLTTDTIDIAVFGSSGNSTTTWYSGLFRDHLVSSLTQPVWKLFSSNVIPTTTVNTASAGYSLATLNSWLTSGILVSNSTVLNVTANATVSSALVANSLTLTTMLTVPSGGTGLATIAAGSVLTGNTTGAITAVAQGVNGAFLTVSGTTTTFTNTIDAGLF